MNCTYSLCTTPWLQGYAKESHKLHSEFQNTNISYYDSLYSNFNFNHAPIKISIYLILSSPLTTSSWKHLHYWLLASRFAGGRCFMALILHAHISKFCCPASLRFWHKSLFETESCCVSDQDWTCFTEFFCYSL